MEALRGTRALVVHDGELADVRRLLQQLGTHVVERRGRAVEADHAHRWQVVVATPELALQLHVHMRVSWALCVVVLDQESRSLRALLRESGIDYIVRRPVHPVAMRGLLAHCLWQRPTRRRHDRVAIGAPIRIQRRFARRHAILADLSVRGARVLASYDPRPGAPLRMLLPPALAGGHALALDGAVVSVLPPPDRRSKRSIALSLAAIAPPEQRRVREIVAAHRAGPAQLTEDEALSMAVPRPPRRRIVPADPEQRQERRSGERRPFEHGLTAVSEDMERILVARDLSLGGMRVHPSPALEIDALIRVQLHDREGDCPLALEARVVRDHGDEGVALCFERVDHDARDRLALFLEAASFEDCLGDAPAPTAVLERVA